MPLNTSNKLFLKNEQGKAEWRTETEDLRATTLAFILGVRSKFTGHNQARAIVDGSEQASGYAEHNVAYQPNIMPGMPGTERFQQLCSLEYLQMYFAQVLSNKTINLSGELTATIDGLDATDKTAGPVGAYFAAVAHAVSAGVENGAQGNPKVRSSGNTLLDLEDIARKYGLENSDAAKAPENFQGIFARDFGPFLKGKGTATQLVNCTVANNAQSFGKDKATKIPVVAQPFSVSRNAGDDLAFAVLDAKLTEVGCTDWRPDGIVLSKGSNDPSDKLSDEYLEARDGQLYNIRVQGPAIGTSWTGERSLETLPLDKVFVVIVADVWFDDVDRSAETLSAGAKISEYDLKRRIALAKPIDRKEFEAKQAAAFMGKKENTVLCNFRVQVSTSSQMINHSNYNHKGNGQAAQNGYKRPRLEGMSRMGLKLCPEFGEYIVGGWQIGQVLDTSASRAAMPSGSLVGVRTAPNSSALNVNVNVSWYTADRLARSFNNPEGTVVTRFNNHQRSKPTNLVNTQASRSAWGSDLTLTEAAGGQPLPIDQAAELFKLMAPAGGVITPVEWFRALRSSADLRRAFGDPKPYLGLEREQGTEGRRALNFFTSIFNSMKATPSARGVTEKEMREYLERRLVIYEEVNTKAPAPSAGGSDVMDQAFSE